ncbi:Selenide, water dikinase 2 [Desulfarculales bacterium]
MPREQDPRLLVGADTSDDAGVFQLTPEIALIQTLDFFTPIVNDPYVFGQIAAANSLSDVYAMGGTPLTAMNICCFPVKEHPPEVFREILRGGLEMIHQAGAVLAGGHSVEDPELKYGLSVTGIVHPKNAVTNAGLKSGQMLVLTKPLGTGTIATALKARLTTPAAVARAVELMVTLNASASQVMRAFGVTGATDITGFGLLGHALELANASGLGLEIVASQVPILEEAHEMAAMGLTPMGSHANREFCRQAMRLEGATDAVLLNLLADAQTNGGLLMGLEPEHLEPALAMLSGQGLTPAVIGRVGVGDPGTITLRF